MQESSTLQSNVDESRLHAGQYAHHLACIDIADQTTLERSFDVQLLNGAVLDDGHAGFLRCPVDEDVLHGLWDWRVSGWRGAGRATRVNAKKV